MKLNFINTFKFINLITLSLILSACDDNRSNFTVAADTKIEPNSEISKYVTQDEVDSFAFRYWDIDTYEVKNNQTMENLRKLLKSKNTTNILNFMKDNNISVDTELHYGVTPLMYASFYDDEETMKKLIKLGADTNATDKYKLSPIAYAIENNSTKAVKTLLDSGVQLDIENLIVQSYQTSPSYSIGLDGIIIDGDNMILSYEDKYGGKEKHGFGDGSSAYGYIISHNFIEIMQMLLERKYIHPTGKMSDCSPQEEFKCSFYNILDNIPNHEPMLNLLLDYNVSGQPSKELLKKGYDECYQNRVNFIKDDYDLYYGNFMAIERLKQYRKEESKAIPISEKEYNRFRPKTLKAYNEFCPDENSTFKSTKEFINYKNWMNKTKEVNGFIYYNRDNPNKVIYLDKR